MRRREGVSPVAVAVVVVLIIVIIAAAIYYSAGSKVTSTSSSSSSSFSTIVGSSNTTLSSNSSSSAAPMRFVANLTAAPGVTTQATGQAIFQLSADGQSLSYTLTVSNITNVFMAHIHLSPSMNIIVWLYPSPNNASNGEAACVAVLSKGPISACPGFKSGSFSGTLAQGTITSADLSGNSTCAGCTGLSSANMSALVAAMRGGQTFVNVHTEQNPGGEIQGTIVASKAQP
jgi:hypothetical protein